MTLLPRRDDFLPSLKSDRPANSKKAEWGHFVAVIANPNLIARFALYAIALLIMINVIFRFPNLGALIEQYNQF